MRLIRSVVRPANFGISRQFQGGQGIKIMKSGLHSELTETSTPVLGAYMQCRGKSNAASAPSDIQDPTKSARRIPKKERKLMVESYVTNYRAMNAGKFPSVTDAQRGVGGSFYIVREIMQELIHNSSVSSSKDTTSLEKVHVKQEVLTDAGEIIRPKEVDELEEQISKVETIVSIPESLESKENEDSSSPVQNNLSDEVRLTSSVNRKSKDIEQHPQPSIEECDRSSNSGHKSEEKHDTLAEHSTKITAQESTESGSELKVPEENIEPQHNASIWQNLKSFANGILGIWRRS